MTGPQSTALFVLVFLSSALTRVLYPSVARQAKSRAHGLLATVMASTLVAVVMAIVLGAIHSAITS